MKLTVDLTNLGNTELRLLGNYLAIRAGACNAAGSTREEKTLRDLIDELQGELRDRGAASILANINALGEELLTRARLRGLAEKHKVRVVPSDRPGCFDLYWPDTSHAFAVSVRDAIATIEFNGAVLPSEAFHG